MCDYCESENIIIFVNEKKYCKDCFFLKYDDVKFVIFEKKDLLAPMAKIKMTTSPVIIVVGPFELYTQSNLYLIFKSQLSKSILNFLYCDSYTPIPDNFFEIMEKCSYKSYSIGDTIVDTKLYNKISKMKFIDKIIHVEHAYACEYNKNKYISKEELLDKYI